jgi:hypothetical protein
MKGGRSAHTVVDAAALLWGWSHSAPFGRLFFWLLCLTHGRSCPAPCTLNNTMTSKFFLATIVWQVPRGHLRLAVPGVAGIVLAMLVCAILFF